MTTPLLALLEIQYEEEITSLRQNLKSRVSQLKSIRYFLDADAKKYQGASVRDQLKISYLEKQIASSFALRDQHCAGITDKKRELDRLQKMIAGLHSDARRKSLV